MRQKGGHGLKARIKTNDIPQAQIDILNRSTYTVEIKDTVTGKVESRVTRPMRSFTANFLRLMWGRMTGTACAGGLDINDTAIDESSGKATNLKCCGATTGLKKFGICIGTGTGAVAQTDNKLTWDTGFSTYGATTTKTATTISGSDIYFEIQKAFVNSTGSTRTIEEIGLCTTGEGTEADNNTNVLIARELTGGDAVATGKTATVEFKISSTFTTDGTINKSFMESLEMAMRNNVGDVWGQAATTKFSVRYGSAAVVHKGAIYVIGGYNHPSPLYLGDVWKSVDFGITWTKIRDTADANGYGARMVHCAWSYDGKLWVGAGATAAKALNNDVWYSSDDGATWTRATASAAFSGRLAAMCCVFDGKMWIMGGYDDAGSYSATDTIYYSTDGATWTTANPGTHWSARQLAGCCVSGSKMYILGGEQRISGSAQSMNDVWYTSNGSTWTRATASAGWSARLFGGAYHINDKLFIVSGYGVGSWNTDCWYSSDDGATWTRASATAISKGRYGSSYCSHKNKMFLMAGFPGAYPALDDVQCCAISPFSLCSSAAMPTSGRVDEETGGVYGITVGTGTDNFVGTDAALGEQIADGSGADELVYGDMTDPGRLSEPSVSGSDNIMRIERDFTNSSGDEITIKEVGLSAKGFDALGLLLMRGKVDKAVADGASVRVAIELETTV